jgi:hypothetical protein
MKEKQDPPFLALPRKHRAQTNASVTNPDKNFSAAIGKKLPANLFLFIAPQTSQTV